MRSSAAAIAVPDGQTRGEGPSSVLNLRPRSYGFDLEAGKSSAPSSIPWS